MKLGKGVHGVRWGVGLLSSFNFELASLGGGHFKRKVTCLKDRESGFYM